MNNVYITNTWLEHGAINRLLFIAPWLEHAAIAPWLEQGDSSMVRAGSFLWNNSLDRALYWP